MVFVRTRIQTGDRVISLQRIETPNGYFTAGHKFKIIGEGDNGYNLRDEEGHLAINVPLSAVKKDESIDYAEFYNHFRR